MSQYNPLEVARNTPGVRRLLTHAQDLGYPDPEDNPNPDWVWNEQQDRVESERHDYRCPASEPYAPFSTSDECQFHPPDGLPPLTCGCDRVTTYFRRRTEVDPVLRVLDGADPVRARTPFFTSRWATLGRNLDGSIQGAWTRFFLANMDPVNPRPDLQIYNTYNRTDSVLRIDEGFTSVTDSAFHAWFTLTSWASHPVGSTSCRRPSSWPVRRSWAVALPTR